MRSAGLLCLFAILAITISLAQTNPVPLISNPLVPTSATPGGASFTLTVNGLGFVSGSVVNWNGSALTTNFVSTSQLTATVPTADIATAGTASLTVLNPAPGGGVSNVVFFDITNPTQSVSFSGPLFSAGEYPNSVTVADFNGDGKLDVAVVSTAYPSSNTVSILMGRGDGTLEEPVAYPTGVLPSAIAVGDFNRDGKPDLAVTTECGGDQSCAFPVPGVSILLGNGDGTFRPYVDYATTAPPVSVVAADFNADGNLDLAIPNNGWVGDIGQTVSVLLGNGDGTFRASVDYPVGQDAASVATGDFNRDGKLDLAVAISGGSQVAVLYGKGDGTFQSDRLVDVARAPWSVIAVDLNGDGLLDLVTASWSSGSVSVVIGNGDGTFQRGTAYKIGAGGEQVTAGDLNGDGVPDLVAASFLGGVSVFLGKGDGTFQPRLAYNFGGGGPDSVAVGDFNQDGGLDVVVAGYGSGDPANSQGVAVLLQTTVTFSKTLLDFGSQSVGTASAPQTVTVTNIGQSSLNLMSIAITEDPQDFVQSNHCGATLDPGASCKIRVVFKPRQRGFKYASLSITDDAVSSPQTVELFGAGTK